MDGKLLARQIFLRTLEALDVADSVSRCVICTNRVLHCGDAKYDLRDVSDLRVIAGLATVPASTNFFKPHPLYLATGALHAHSIHFADGTSVYAATGSNGMFVSPVGTTFTWSALNGSGGTALPSIAATGHRWPLRLDDT